MDELRRAVEIAEGASDLRPAIAARLTMVILHLRNAEIDEAVATGERVVLDAEREFGPNHPETATAFGAYSAALSAAERFDEAGAAVTRSLAILDAAGPIGVTPANGVACNWCSGISRVCRADAAPACLACIDRVLRTATPTRSSIGGLGIGLEYLRSLGSPHAPGAALRVLDALDDDPKWEWVRGVAAHVAFAAEPSRALDVARELCPTPSASSCSAEANMLVAIHDADVRRREVATASAVERWRKSTASEQSDLIAIGLALAQRGHLTRSDLEPAVAYPTSPCNRDRDAAVAWIAGDGTSVTAPPPK